MLPMHTNTSSGKTSLSVAYELVNYGSSESVGRILIRNAPIIKGYNVNGCNVGHQKYEDAAKLFKLEYNAMKSKWRLCTQANMKDLLCSSRTSSSTLDICAKGSWSTANESLFSFSKWVLCTYTEIVDFEIIDAARKKQEADALEKKRLKELAAEQKRQEGQAC
jgi:hypothetical protein